MKSKQKRNNTVRIITVTILAASITIALFIVSVTVLGAIIPAPTSPTLTNKTIDGAGGYQENLNGSDPLPSLLSTKISSPNTTEAVAEVRHEHASIMVFINGNLLNFSHPKYQNQDLLMHFEGSDGFTIHKHAKKVGLDLFSKVLT